MEWLPEWIDGWMNINVFSLLITIWVLKFWNHCMCVVELGKWVNILMLLKVREEYLQRISTSHLQIQNGENKEEPWGVLESEISRMNMQVHTPHTCTYTHLCAYMCNYFPSSVAGRPRSNDTLIAMRTL